MVPIQFEVANLVLVCNGNSAYTKYKYVGNVNAVQRRSQDFLLCGRGANLVKGPMPRVPQN